MPKELKHLLLMSTEEMSNPKAWSGIPWSLRKALETRVEQMTVFQPSAPARSPLDVVKRVVFGAKKHPLWITKASLRKAGREVSEEIARVKPDAVLSISSHCIAYLPKQAIPVGMFSDAPYLAFAEAYARWETYPVRLKAFAREEAAGARRVDGLFFGSEWACGEARRLYGLDAGASERLHVTPLGANWVPKIGREEIFARIEGRGCDCIDLLYLGKDWERKGGPLAVEVTALLRAAGREAHLHVVGCRPELGDAAGPGGFVTVHGLLYQDAPEQSAKLAELFLSSHFLIVPTLAECYGIVFAEAQAFGLPPISRAVHALPTVVEDGVTGLLFAVDAPASEYVERILNVVGDREEYEAMAKRARERFERRLSWEATADAIVGVLAGALR